MIELRWMVKHWDEYPDGRRVIHLVEKPVLQYRVMENSMEIGVQPPIWSEWTDVETVRVDQ